MSLILCIETATSVCSVAVSHNGQILALQELNEPNVHNRLVTVFIDECIKKAGITLQMLDAIAVSKGPGSYTGLRIGVSTAKGLCFSLDKPLIGINTLQAMAAGFLHSYPTLPANSLIAPMIDARRMEVYTAFFNRKGEFVRETCADIIDATSYSEVLATQSIYFFGDGAAKCRSALGNDPNALFIDDKFPSATYMGSLAHKLFEEKNFENIAYFEPFYLKDFVTTTAKRAI